MSEKRKKYDRLLETDWIGQERILASPTVKSLMGKLKRAALIGPGVAQIGWDGQFLNRRKKSASSRDDR